MKLQIHVLLLLLLVAAGCRKQDIEPEPVGNPVPHEAGPDKTWQQLLAASPYTRFREAWQLSGMDEKVKQSGSGFYTVLVPSDKAFDEAGWTTAKIKAATKEELDELLTIYVMPARLTPENIAAVPAATRPALPCQSAQWRAGTTGTAKTISISCSSANMATASW
ncbi:putative surface protein with fasciclin (FAS1) repeats [Chitinophaga sp. W3I9]|uniref:fasciclin domain-containing protein n=1 Tax=Chitinophaga sp. W3I9 TaxID=3373924 RepID=UPI003D25BA3F